VTPGEPVYDNIWTPGEPPSAEIAAQSGTHYLYGPQSEPTTGEDLGSGVKRFPANPRARDFDGTYPGLKVWQEYGAFQFVSGATNTYWESFYLPDGGPRGAGDGAFEIEGTSLSVAPCTMQCAVARWTTEEFTYDAADAESGKIDFDMLTTLLLAGDGHSSYTVEICDHDGRVVTTGHGPEGIFPLNEWDHHEAYIDIKKLVYGKKYKICGSVKQTFAETAASLGKLIFDNISLTVSPKPGPSPEVPCTVSGSTSGSLELTGLLAGGSTPDLCQTLTNPLGQTLAPVTDTVYCLVACGAIGDVVNRLSGLFIVLDLTTGQCLGYLIGKESVPSLDPEQLMAYIKDGTLGKAVGSVLLLVKGVTNGLLPKVLGDPLGTVTRIVGGQLQNVTDILARPTTLTQIDLGWTVDNLGWVVGHLTGPLSSGGQTDAALGGVVFIDENGNGIWDRGEPVQPGVKASLTDANGNDYGYAITGPDGRYLFPRLQPRTDPSYYQIKFTGPDGEPLWITRKYVGLDRRVMSSANSDGSTDRIPLSHGQVDLTWNAGLTEAFMPGQPGQPGQPANVSISVGTPAVSPNPVTAGEDTTITLPVTNTGNVPIELSQLTATVDGQQVPLDCGQGQLMPGQTANCTLHVTAKPDTNTLTIVVAVPGANGMAQTATCQATYTGQAPCACDRAKESQTGAAAPVIGSLG
jgi:hypothetical protein